MSPITAARAPDDSLIAPFRDVAGHYADAFTVVVPGQVDLQGLIAAFYTTPLFRAERLVLRLAGHGSRDDEVAALARGGSERFAAWRVEARREAEILLADISGRTKSWLCVVPETGATRIWFGSVVVPSSRSGRLGVLVSALIPAHRLYSRLLLRAAAARLRRRSRRR